MAARTSARHQEVFDTHAQQSLLLATLCAILALTLAACTAPEPTPAPAFPEEAIATIAATATAAAERAPAQDSVPIAKSPHVPTPSPAPTAMPAPAPTPEPTPRPTLLPLSVPAPSTPEPPTPAPTPVIPLTVSANRIKALPWVADGVRGPEREAVKILNAIAVRSGDVFDNLMNLRWMQDEITVHEAAAIDEIYGIAYYAPDLAEAMLAKPWVQDDITRDEAVVIDRLNSTIRAEDESLQHEVIQRAIDILGMPFLDTVESPDALAVRSLESFEDEGSAGFLELMVHPALSDGITDEEAKIVLLLDGTRRNTPQSVPLLLNGLLTGDGVYQEERTIHLPLSGAVTLAIVRLRDQVTHSMDYFEHAVHNLEGFMSVPFPTNHLVWYFDAPTAGQHHGTHISSHPERDEIDYARGPRHIAHESAHYHWSSTGTHWLRYGMQRWIAEGGADFVTIISENARVGRPLDANRSPCFFAIYIRELELADPEPEDPEYSCTYRLGQRLFLDLYLNLDQETFRQGFRNLYLKRLRDAPDDGCGDSDLNICHVRHAFKEGVSPEVATTVDQVIARWYDGTEPYDLSRLDHRPVDPSLPAVNGQLADAFISLDQEWSADPSVRTGRVSLAQLKALNGRVYLYWRATFPNATQTTGIPLTTVEYYMDGFVHERNEHTLPVREGTTERWDRDAIGSSDPDRWAIGTHGVYIYQGGRKVAQVEFEIVP